jgi:uncharacterized membrane protein (DUF4010 family)
VGGAASAAYLLDRSHSDPGLTTEVALVVTFLLGALTKDRPDLAASLGVVVTVVLYARHQLHRFVRDLLTVDELQDALLLAAAAVVVLPLVPNRGFGPGGALNPFPFGGWWFS